MILHHARGRSLRPMKSKYSTRWTRPGERRLTPPSGTLDTPQLRTLYLERFNFVARWARGETLKFDAPQTQQSADGGWPRRRNNRGQRETEKPIRLRNARAKWIPTLERFRRRRRLCMLAFVSLMESAGRITIRGDIMELAC